MRRLNSQLKKDWVLTEEAFDRVLGALDPDRETAGERYEMLRLKLVKYFEWQSLSLPEDLADEAIDRLARKLSENGHVESLNAFALGIARHIASEERRRRIREKKAAGELLSQESLAPGSDEVSASKGHCFECLSELTRDDRLLILRYYSVGKAGKIKDHKRMAEEIGTSINSMRIRVHRIKLKLKRCIRYRAGIDHSS